MFVNSGLTHVHVHVTRGCMFRLKSFPQVDTGLHIYKRCLFIHVHIRHAYNTSELYYTSPIGYIWADEMCLVIRK